MAIIFYSIQPSVICNFLLLLYYPFERGAYKERRRLQLPKITILKTRSSVQVQSAKSFFSHAFSETNYIDNFNDCFSSHFFSKA